MKKGFVLLCLLSAILGTVSAQKMRIAVAANAEFVARQLAEQFKKETGIDAQLIIGSSGKLTAQIQNDAPFDVFMSADMKYPLELAAKNLTLQKPKIYAYGQLVLWVMDAGTTLSPNDLLLPRYNKIAIANPQLAPYGEAAVAALKKLQLYDKLSPKIVYGESIAQVNQYVLTGATQAAFTAKSIVLSPEEKNKGRWVPIDETLYVPIAQGAVLLRSSRVNNLADGRKFYAFLFSPIAKKILHTYGYN